MTTPVFFEGTLPCEDAGTIDRVHQGIPLTAEGRVCISIDGTVSFVHNGVPYDSDGRVVIVDEGDDTRIKINGKFYFLKTDGDIVGYLGGLPYGTPGGELGPSFSEYTASGSLAIGDVVSLASTGVVEEVSETTVEAGVKQKISAGAKSFSAHVGVIRDEVNSRVAFISRDGSSFSADIFDVVDDELVYSAAHTDFYTDPTGSVQSQFQVVYDPFRNNSVVIYRTFNGSTAYLRMFPISSIGASAVTALTARTIQSAASTASYTSFVGIVRPSNGELLVAFQDNTIGSGLPFYVYASTQTGTRSPMRYAFSTSSGNSRPRAGYYDEAYGQYILVNQGTLGSFQVAGYTISSYNSTPSGGSPDDNGDDCRDAVGYWVGSPINVGGVFWGDVTLDSVFHRYVTRSGASVDWSASKNTLYSPAGFDPRVPLAQPQKIGSTWYVGFFFCSRLESDKWLWVPCRVNSATSFSFLSAAAEFADGGSSIGSVTALPTAGDPIVATYEGSDFYLNVFRMVDELVSNNSEFVGIAQSAANDSEPVLVATSGMVAEGLSGLTPSTTYYVDSDGSLTTTDTGVEAGVAQSETTLLVA